MQRVLKLGRAGRMAVALMAIVIITACAPAIQQPTTQAGAVPTALPDEFHADVSEQRRLWRQQTISNYRVRIEFIEDATRSTVTQHEALIDRNTSRGARCIAGACPTSIFKRIISVTDLFAFMQDIPESCVNEVLYDLILHYPSYVSADCADGVAHPFVIRITYLQPLN